jgi:hypothetical protein
MSLKLLTTICLVVGLALLLPDGLLLKSAPGRDASLAVRRGYVEKLFLVNGLVVLCLVGAGVGSTLIVRKAKEEYRAESMKNLKKLLEPENDA